MKKLSVCLTLLLFTFTVYAQNKDEKSVAQAVQALNKAIIDPDRTTLAQLAADELSYGHSGGKVQNKAEFIEDLVSGPFDFKTIHTSEEEIKVAGDLAIVRHILSFTALNNGAPVDLKIGNLLVWRKLKGEWKLSVRQAFKLP